MAAITLLRPDVPAPVAERTDRAARRPLPEGAVLTIVENGKPRAKEVLEGIADVLRSRLPVDRVELVSKPSAAKPIDADEARMLAVRSHLVLCGVGD